MGTQKPFVETGFTGIYQVSEGFLFDGPTERVYLSPSIGVKWLNEKRFFYKMYLSPMFNIYCTETGEPQRYNSCDKGVFYPIYGFGVGAHF